MFIYHKGIFLSMDRYLVVNRLFINKNVIIWYILIIQNGELNTISKDVCLQNYWIFFYNFAAYMPVCTVNIYNKEMEQEVIKYIFYIYTGY